MQERIRVYRATLDTNIFVRAIISPSGINACLIDLWKQDRFILVLSKDIVEEIFEILLRPELINRYPYSQKDVENLANLINQGAVIITPQISFDYCRDPDDNKFISCAIVGRVQYLVSGDNDLVDDKQLQKTLREYGVQISTALEFVREIEFIN